MHVFADGISKVTLSNGNLRIMLTQRGADDSQVEAGTMIIPASQASNFLNGLASSLRELDEKLKAAREEEPEEIEELS
ncbi:hypothetical protein Dthio_PD1523 [Desulfonatronospira thiodismutans ASO3-1]|uniref:Uncharacterized protein n=1 Tax=Desulfonatronospira thiodismutans ASO3-1 TaxID=555779 RepID=D6SN49_9BACT|nr:hypothetical protein [Desulfonatronospira thiodismutans]EFI34175.1 hypothetical protein Dthio_PD1523 [Desulfonatronospira thiodismutans ASO3-1]